MKNALSAAVAVATLAVAQPASAALMNVFPGNPMVLADESIFFFGEFNDGSSFGLATEITGTGIDGAPFELDLEIFFTLAADNSFESGGFTLVDTVNGTIVAASDSLVDAHSGADLIELRFNGISGTNADAFGGSAIGQIFFGEGFTDVASELNALDTFAVDAKLSAAVPLPAALPLLLGGLAALGYVARRRA
ncbi:MAG: VPLPA-CTERM sorting domain-containing protein [Paracoccaceae bacterium]